VLSEFGEPWTTLSLVDLQNGIALDAFGSLEKLVMRQNCCIIRTILAVVRGPLHHLVCTIEGAVLPDEIRSLAKSIAHFHHSLGDLTLELFDVTTNEHDSGKWRDLDAVWDCQGLVNVRISYILPGQRLTFSDTELISLGRKCPELENLSISWTREQTLSFEQRMQLGGLKDEKALTLFGVIEMLYLCPKLTRVDLTSINTSTPNCLSVTAAPIQRVIHLSFRSILVHDPSNTALRLSIRLPQVALKLIDPAKNKKMERQVHFIMGILHFTRSFRLVQQHPELSAEFKMPDPLRVLEDMMRVKM
jgi:hypothetical protein